MGVPTVSVSMGVMDKTKMPVNLTFAGKHGQDSDLLRYAYAYEQQSNRRVEPPCRTACDTSAEIGCGPASSLWQVDARLCSQH